MEESQQEQYLRQIRDVEMHNRQLLEKIVTYNEKDEKRRKWRILGRIAMVIMPFLLTILLGWFFYFKIVSTLGSFQDGLKDAIPELPSISDITNSADGLLDGLFGDKGNE